MIDLEEYDDSFVPSTRTGQAAGLDTLPDETYEFEIKKAALRCSKKTRVFSLVLEVLTAGAYQGQEVERPSFVTSQEAANRLGADLKTLGFDVQNWLKANDRPFSGELDKALKLLPGIRFRGKKITNDNDREPTKPYHNLYINERLTDDGKPAEFGQDELNSFDADSPF